MSKNFVPALILALALILTACGDSDSGAAPSAGTGTAAAAAAAAPAPPPAPEKPEPPPEPKSGPKPSSALPASGAPEGKPAPAAPPVQAKSGFKLGVVDLKACYDNEKHELIKDVDAELRAMAQSLNQRIKDLEQKEGIAKQKLAALDREKQPRLWQNKRRELAIIQTEIKFETELGKVQYVRFYNQKKSEVYNAVRDVVNAIAREQDFDLVLRVEDAQLKDAAQTAAPSITQQINTRVVLYHNEGVDITERVLKRLNENYRKKKAAGNNK